MLITPHESMGLSRERHSQPKPWLRLLLKWREHPWTPVLSHHGIPNIDRHVYTASTWGFCQGVSSLSAITWSHVSNRTINFHVDSRNHQTLRASKRGVHGTEWLFWLPGNKVDCSIFTPARFPPFQNDSIPACNVFPTHLGDNTWSDIEI